MTEFCPDLVLLQLPKTTFRFEKYYTIFLLWEGPFQAVLKTNVFKEYPK